jgi:hypothetical protein
LREFAELRSILGRNAEQSSDHADRQAERELVHEFSHAVLDHRVQQLVDHALDLRSQRFDRARHNLAQLAVPRVRIGSPNGREEQFPHDLFGRRRALPGL